MNCAGNMALEQHPFFLLEITLLSAPLFLFWLSKRKNTQIPQDTHSLSQNNYKMLYASVNTTSVTVTVCICQEMRQKQNEFALKQNEGGFFFCVCCSLMVLWAFVPTLHKWVLMFHTGFAAEESRSVRILSVLSMSVFLFLHLTLFFCAEVAC